jgi:hypothetical protein
MSNQQSFTVSMTPKENCDPEDVDIAPDIEITVKYGIDGTVVVEIDTPELPENDKGPIIRIWLNDDTVYENPPVPVLVGL